MTKVLPAILAILPTINMATRLGVEGHRGAISHFHENSMEAFLEADRLGIDGIEFDVWMLKDGVPAIAHGKSSNGLEVMWQQSTNKLQTKFLPLMTSGELQGYRFPDFKTRVPLFEELLVAMKNSKLRLNCEIKHMEPQLVTNLLEIYKRVAPKCELVFSSFNHAVRPWIDSASKAAGLPDFSFGFLAHQMEALPKIVDGKVEGLRPGDTINIDITMILADEPRLREYIDAVRKAGYHVKVYNLMTLTQFETPETYQKLLDYNVHTFICNNVEKLIEFNRKQDAAEL